jgi:hypothetical protein
MRTDGPLTPQDLQTGANHEYSRCAVGFASPPQNGHGNSLTPPFNPDAPLSFLVASFAIVVPFRALVRRSG